MNFSKNRKGFTLIELLVVIAIVGLLASVAVYSLNNARMKARDSKRIADLKQISSALELYYDNNGYYPIRDGGTGEYSYTFSDWGGHCGGTDLPSGSWCQLETVLAPYLARLPRDPLGEKQLNYYYIYRSHGNGKSYGLAIGLEGSNTIFDGGCVDSLYEFGPSLTRCGCEPRSWHHQGTDLCP